MYLVWLRFNPLLGAKGPKFGFMRRDHQESQISTVAAFNTREDADSAAGDALSSKIVNTAQVVECT